MNNSPANIRQWLCEEFSSHLATVFESMAGDRPKIETDSADAPPPADPVLRWRQPFAGVPGAIWVIASESAWTAAGGHVLRAAGIEESDAASLKSTYLEALGQALSGVATTMGRRAGHEVTCTGGAESPSTGDSQWSALRIHLGAETVEIVIGIESALANAMIPAAPREKAGAAAASAGASFIPPANSKTFELLLDVELPVSVSFGRAQVSLKDVLKLTTGSIVELNRSILEPVEVIVNNCVIARGEVVVVDGNFGVRVYEVISRQERLRTLN